MGSGAILAPNEATGSRVERTYRAPEEEVSKFGEVVVRSRLFCRLLCAQKRLP